MPKSRGRKPKKKRTPASAPKKRLDHFNTTPQEPALSTQPPQEPPLATAPRQEQPTPKIKQIAKLTTAVVLAAIAIVLCAYAFIWTKKGGGTRRRVPGVSEDFRVRVQETGVGSMDVSDYCQDQGVGPP